MRRVIVVLLFMACAPKINFKESHKNSSEQDIFFRWNQFAIDADNEAISFLLEKSPKTSLKYLREHLVLGRSPKKETLKETDLFLKTPFSVSKTDKKNEVELKPKERLLAGSLYGFYWRDKNSNNLELAYTFLVKNGPPKIVSHDLSEHEPITVCEGRILFSLTFDQPIVLHDDQAITIESLTDSLKAPSIESLTVLMDRKTIKIKLVDDGDNQLTAGQKYAFVVGKGLTNVDKVSSNQKPLEFTVGESQGFFKEIEPMVLSTSHNSVDITWLVNQAHATELFIAKDAPVTNKNVPTIFQSSTGFYKSLDRFHVSPLDPESSYRFVLRSEYHDGRVLVLDGSFKTTLSEGFYISEIMVNPDIKGHNDQRGEFIEMVNLSGKDQLVNDLRVSIEDVESHKISSCHLDPSDQALLIPKNSYFLIVSQEFDESLYIWPRGTIIFHLNKKTLCGGLADNKQKIIKIFRNEGHYLDRYGGYLWSSKAGQSIQRINTMGLDDRTNYCYSQPSLGPTPGKKNGPCGQ